MAQQGAHGGMDIHEQQDTFHSFLTATVWTCALIAQGVALLTLAFAIGAGWWAGFVAFVVIGVAAGLSFKMSSAWWASQVLLWVLMVIGGLIVPAISGLMG